MNLQPCNQDNIQEFDHSAFQDVEAETGSKFYIKNQNWKLFWLNFVEHIEGMCPADKSLKQLLGVVLNSFKDISLKVEKKKHLGSTTLTFIK